MLEGVAEGMKGGDEAGQRGKTEPRRHRVGYQTFRERVLFTRISDLGSSLSPIQALECYKGYRWMVACFKGKSYTLCPYVACVVFGAVVVV
jgi:hypothetical protein